MPKASSVAIRKNIPIPIPHSTYSPYKWDQLEIGDSFLFPPNVNPASCYGMVSKANNRFKSNGVVFACRKTPEGDIGCWRVA